MELTDLDIDEEAKLGQGSNGHVYLATHIPTGKKVAVKKLMKYLFKGKKNLAKAFEREIEIYKKLKHINIVRLYKHLENEDYYFLVMEYIPRRNLF